jgi:alpha/beta superfamily hydrolase
MGGDRFNNVVDALYRELPAAGVSALRFDFGSSSIEAGGNETVQALDQLDDLPRYIVGYSFGGGIAATVTDARVAGWYLIAPALTMVEPTIGEDPRPKGIASAEHDRFFSPARIEQATTGWDAIELSTITGADHMFVGRTDEVTKTVLEWLTRVAR